MDRQPDRRRHRRVTCRVAPCEQQGATKKENLFVAIAIRTNTTIEYEIYLNISLQKHEDVKGSRNRSNSNFDVGKNSHILRQITLVTAQERENPQEQVKNEKRIYGHCIH